MDRLTVPETVALRILVNCGPLSDAQLRKLFGPKWKALLMSLTRRGYIFSTLKPLTYAATDEGKRAA